MIRLIFSHIVEFIDAIIFRHRLPWLCNIAGDIWPEEVCDCWICNRFWPIISDEDE